MNHTCQIVIASTLVWVCLLIAGCGRPTSLPAGPNLGGSNGTITWTKQTGNDDARPGIDQGNLYHLGTAFVIWSDNSGGGGGSSSAAMGTVKCEGSLLGRDGRRVDFLCDIADGKPGQAKINGVTYELADGNLFLVSTEAERPRVQQLKRDLSGLKFERDDLEAFGKQDPEITKFFAAAANPK